MDLELKGKVAIVTGGNRGIGKAIGARAGAGGRQRGADRAQPGHAGDGSGGDFQSGRRQGQGLRVRHHRRRGGEEDGGGRGGGVRPGRHPRQLRRQAERAGAAADAGRNHHRGVLGPRQHEGGGLPAHRARGGAAHDQAEVGPHHQRQRARRAPHRHHHRQHPQRRRGGADQEPGRRARRPTASRPSACIRASCAPRRRRA